MSVPNQKYRHEFKYLVSVAEIALLKNRIVNLMQKDPYAGNDGIYNIRSLYFDDCNNRCFYENENGTDPREKYRIRIYNHNSKRITLECKRKERGKTRKTSCSLTKEQTDRIINGCALPILETDPPLLKKFLLEVHTCGMHPVVIVEYERIPFVYKNGNVRITFDTHLASSSDVTNFFAEKIHKRPVMPVGYHLMEVKFDEYLPDVIYRCLNLEQLQQTTYSKYYLCRKYTSRK